MTVQSFPTVMFLVFVLLAVLTRQARAFRTLPWLSAKRSSSIQTTTTSTTRFMSAEDDGTLFSSVNDKQLLWDDASGRFIETNLEQGDRPLAPPALDYDTYSAAATPPENAVVTSQEVASSSTADDGASSTMSNGVEEYKNFATTVLSNFMNPNMDQQQQQQQLQSAPSSTSNSNDQENDILSSITNSPIDSIDFTASKFAYDIDLETMAKVLDAELYQREWFVTGNVNPIYFDDDFRFEDPDVKLQGIENYARGVYKIFDQSCSRAEILSTRVNPELGDNWITCTWRLSGKAKIGPGITIKPYIVYSDLRINSQSGLVDFQQDRFDIPSWDILLSAVFPFLIGKVCRRQTNEPLKHCTSCLQQTLTSFARSYSYYFMIGHCSTGPSGGATRGGNARFGPEPSNRLSLLAVWQNFCRLGKLVW